MAWDRETRNLWRINKYLWMALGAVALSIPFAHSRGLLVISPLGAWLLFGAGVGNVALRTYLGHRLASPEKAVLKVRTGWILLLIDLVLLALAIYSTQGLESDFWLLYLVIGIAETIHATSVEARIISVLIALSYLGGTLPHQWGAFQKPTLDFLSVLALRLAFAVLVARYARRVSYNDIEKSREITLLREQVAVNEERARIAREVHDGVGHTLVSVILRLELCLRLFRKAPDEAEEILRAEVPALREAWNEGRDLAFHLRPWEMNTNAQEDFAGVLRRHLGRFAERTGIVTQLVGEEAATGLRPEAAFCLMRIVQEALTNVAKHAEATEIVVRFSRDTEARLLCDIEDNGSGFKVEQRDSGLGLKGMRERAEGLGGTLAVESTPQQGTRVRFSLPT